METKLRARRETWRTMTHQDKHQLLQQMRQRQQRQVELEMLRLPLHTR